MTTRLVGLCWALFVHSSAKTNVSSSSIKVHLSKSIFSFSYTCIIIFIIFIKASKSLSPLLTIFTQTLGSQISQNLKAWTFCKLILYYFVFCLVLNLGKIVRATTTQHWLGKIEFPQ